MKPFPRLFRTLVCALLFALASIAAAHGHDENNTAEEIEHHNNFNMSAADAAARETPSYFRFPDHAALMLIHIVLMCISWIFVLPLSK